MTALGAKPVDRLRATDVERGKLNVLIFGPGRGEAIVVVLPNDEVGVVDGCAASTDAKTGAGNPVHEFLVEWMRDRRRRTPTRRRDDERLLFAAITHMHEDHYLGIDAVLSRYAPRFVWRTAVNSDNDLAAAVRASGVAGARRAALNELFAVLDRLRRRENPPEDRTLVSDASAYSVPIAGVNLVIQPAGPTPADVQNANAKLRDAPARSSGADPNSTSGAMLLSWGRACVLLAGDLLASAKPNQGWGRFLSTLAIPTDVRVQLVNAAHHGSLGAHDEALWTRMNPEITVVTPFQHATADQPPQRADLDRFSVSGSRVFVTSRPDWLLPDPPKSAVPAARKDRSDPRNAVLVALDHDGSICKVVLAGNAFEHPLPPPAPPAP